MIYQYILFVEDEPQQQDLCETAVKDWNKANAHKGRSLKLEIADNVEHALMRLDRVRYNGALFDLRVKQNTESTGRAEPAGNALARQAKRELGIPVAIMTADASALELDILEGGLVSVFDKIAKPDEVGTGYDNAIAWFGDQWQMMDILEEARRRISSSAAEVFLKRLWPRWKDIAELDSGDPSAVTAVVTRQYVSHIADLLGLDGDGNATWHPFENYTHPALFADRAHTGDIFKLGEELWIVLTPQCDMATKKIPNVMLAQCISDVPMWAEKIAALKAAESKSKVDDATRFLSDKVNQNVGLAQHFLPPLPGSNAPAMVHFNKIMTMPLSDLNAKLDARVASIATPFLSNIVQRFGAYVSRMGQPNIDVKRFI